MYVLRLGYETLIILKKQVYTLRMWKQVVIILMIVGRCLKLCAKFVKNANILTGWNSSQNVTSFIKLDNKVTL